MDGFTIVETLIVLAVTGALFVAVAATLSGRQNQTEFDQAIQDVRGHIQQTINEVGAGDYTNMGNFKCVQSGSGNAIYPKLTAGNAAAGTNSDCVFLGKAMQFGVATTTGGPEQLLVYSVAGLRNIALVDNPSTDLAAATPRVIAPTSITSGVPDDSQTYILRYGLHMAWMKGVVPGKPQANIVAMAFLSSQGSVDTTTGLMLSGSQQINLVPIMTAVSSDTRYNGASSINNYLDGSPVVDTTNNVQICFASGGTNQSGLITIGGNSDSQLAVQLAIKNGTNC